MDRPKPTKTEPNLQTTPAQTLCHCKHNLDQSAQKPPAKPTQKRTLPEQILQTVCKPGLFFGKEQKENP
jgi:hypothetical protein